MIDLIIGVMIFFKHEGDYEAEEAYESISDEENLDYRPKSKEAE